MDTSYPRKAGALGLAILRSPRDLAAYLRTLPFAGRSPLSTGLPWFCFDAIRELERYLQPHHEVFEFGSGGSTLFLARRASRVLSVESHEDWQQRTVIACRQAGLRNADIRTFPLAEHDREFRANSFFHAVKAQEWDVVIIDSFLGHASGGNTGKGLFRPYAFEISLAQVRPGGLLVLDDSWMFPELLRPPPGWTMKDFHGIGPCRWGVTSTAIFRRDATQVRGTGEARSR